MPSQGKQQLFKGTRQSFIAVVDKFQEVEGTQPSSKTVRGEQRTLQASTKTDDEITGDSDESRTAQVVFSRGPEDSKC